MLQNFFNALFSGCGDNSGRYLECTISPSEMALFDSSLITSERQTKQKAETWSIPAFMI